MLTLEDGLSHKGLEVEPGYSEQTVGKMFWQFSEYHIKVLLGEYLAGRPRNVSDIQITEVINRTLETTPKDATPLLLRALTPETGPSHTAVVQTCNASVLQQHRYYVLWVDEKFRIQALGHHQPILPVAPGVAELRTIANIRKGTTCLLVALHIDTGAVIGKYCKRPDATESFGVLNELDRCTLKGQDLHPIMDVYSKRKTPDVMALLARRTRRRFYFMATSANWLNQVERWFAELTSKKINAASNALLPIWRLTPMRSQRLTIRTANPLRVLENNADSMSSVKHLGQKNFIDFRFG